MPLRVCGAAILQHLAKRSVAPVWPAAIRCLPIATPNACAAMSTSAARARSKDLSWHRIGAKAEDEGVDGSLSVDVRIA